MTEQERTFKTEWQEIVPQCRAAWTNRYGGSNAARWEEHEPRYRYGWEAAANPSYQGRDWSEIEADLQRDWSTRYSNISWEEASDAVRDAWEISNANEQKLRLHEEEMHTGTNTTKTGEVRVRKEVVSEEQTREVPVTHEEVTVDRHPVHGKVPASEEMFKEEEVRVPTHEEHAYSEKRPVVKEEVHVSKQPVQESEQVSETIRHEEAHVEREGHVPMHGSEAEKGKSKPQDKMINSDKKSGEVL
jgi:uncharacterized protein (TIGR02271 family)